ncbi:MAG: HAMP domain-containing protein [Desulfobacterales bacterium]|jgi:signal transduction histidine kinase|nr:HAMP domain-containing protein [Desulfobacterales bacterium]
MERLYSLANNILSKDFLLNYHIGEEFLIGFICLLIAVRAFRTIGFSVSGDQVKSSRIFLVGASFFILGSSSLIHAIIHASHSNLNLLYQTLLAYSLGLFILILAISVENPRNKVALPLLYIPLLALLHPAVYEQFPLFGQFRPLVWILIAYLSGIVCMLYIGTFYRRRSKRFLFSALGHLIICIGAIFLFFPAQIGSTVWLHGHIMRPLGFVILFFSMNRKELLKMEGSILYRALAAFSILAAIPLLFFGTFVFYDNISPVTIIGRRFIIFLLLLITLISGLLFGLGMIIRLIRPILQLKSSVDGMVGDGMVRRIPVQGNDEIGELSGAFNDMLARLDNAIEEQERMCRLAATGELAATLAHEIKNPLNAIGGAATYIGKNTKGSLTKEFVSVITSEVSRINNLTTTLLSFSKTASPNPEPTDLNRVVRDSLTLLSKESPDLQVTVIEELAADLPLVNCDYNQIKQVIINLLINAHDAVSENGEIKVKTWQKKNRTYLAVEDNGSGISAEIIHNIFNPFFTTKTRGTGLGLAISKKIAKEHGGDLTVESTPGEGSTFTLGL